MWYGVKYCFQNDAVDHIIRRFGIAGIGGHYGLMNLALHYKEGKLYASL